MVVYGVRTLMSVYQHSHAMTTESIIKQQANALFNNPSLPLASEQGSFLEPP